MPTVKMVQPPVHKVIEVFTVRNTFVLAILMAARASNLRALIGVVSRNLNYTFVEVTFMGLVEMAVMKKIVVAIMTETCVAAIFIVDVCMRFMC